MNGYLRFVENILPTIVTLHTSIPASNPSSRILGNERMGTGTIVHPEGYILTAGYIVLGASRISVTLAKSQKLSAELVDHDFDSGISVVRVGERGLPALPMGDSDATEIGQETLAVASAGEAQRKINTGFITDLGGFEAYWEYKLDKAIRTTAVNPGLGGGALVNYHGEMIGVVSLNLNEVRGSTLAIPINCYRAISEDVEKYGGGRRKRLRPWLGTYVQPHANGIVIFGVAPASPAETAGLEAGDVVMELDHQEISSRSAYYEHLWRHNPGEPFELLVLRDKELRSVQVCPTTRAAYFG